MEKERQEMLEENCARIGALLYFQKILEIKSLTGEQIQEMQKILKENFYE